MDPLPKFIRRHVEHCMGTVFSFDVRGPGVPEHVIAEAVSLLHDIDATFSTYRADSAISRLARGELQLVDAPPVVRSVLAECERWEQRTDGWFCVRAGATLDPSGYVKGWAIKRVSDLLRAAGSTNHCVNGGGDVQCVGLSAVPASAVPASAVPEPSPVAQPWRVGIADPRDPTRIVTVITGADIAVATSGSAERGTHVLDPFTGRPPAAPLLSLSVSGRSVLDCDIYATAGFAMGDAAHEWFAARTDVQAFAVAADGSTWSTFAQS